MFALANVDRTFNNLIVTRMEARVIRFYLVRRPECQYRFSPVSTEQRDSIAGMH